MLLRGLRARFVRYAWLVRDGRGQQGLTHSLLSDFLLKLNTAMYRLIKARMSRVSGVLSDN